MDPIVVVADATGWKFFFEENLVTQLRVDYRFTLILECGVEIVIDEPFVLRSGGLSETVPPGEEVYEVAAALPLFNKRVGSVHAARDGVLSISFLEGQQIDVPPNQGYENWQVILPDGRMWVGLPGGGVHLWTGSPQR